MIEPKYECWYYWSIEDEQSSTSGYWSFLCTTWTLKGAFKEVSKAMEHPLSAYSWQIIFENKSGATSKINITRSLEQPRVPCARKKEQKE